MDSHSLCVIDDKVSHAISAYPRQFSRPSWKSLDNVPEVHGGIFVLFSDHILGV